MSGMGRKCENKGDDMKSKRNNIAMGIAICILLIIPSVGTVEMDETEILDEIHLEYSFGDPSVNEVSLYNKIFTRINLANLPLSCSPGKPRLPVKPVNVLLPQNSIVESINVEGIKHELSRTYMIEPAQYSIPLNEGFNTVSPKKLKTIEVPSNTFYEDENWHKEYEKNSPSNSLFIDSTVYDSSDVFPGGLYTNLGIQKFRGYSILVVNLHPVQYTPQEGKICYYSELTLSVEISEKQLGNEMYRGLPTDQEKVKNIVDNPAVVGSYKEDMSTLTCSPLSLVDPSNTYQYVIITNETLNNSAGAHTFQDLRNSKVANGMNATIVTVEDITNDSAYWNTTDSLFNDTQAQIRNFIIDAYGNWGTIYVLLGGDTDVIPVRLLYNETAGYTEDIPSDSYYACLGGTYNSNSNSNWGEPTDGENGEDVDLYAEVYVGRAPVGNTSELSNFVKKTLAYENTVLTDSYLKEVSLAGEYLGFGGVGDWGGNSMDELIDGSTSHGNTTIGIPSSVYNISKLYDRNGNMTKITIDISYDARDNPNVQIAFILYSDSDITKAGFYIDDVEIIADGTSVFSDDMDPPNPGWSHSGSQDEWENGTPIRTPEIYGGAPHSGSKCWATDLSNTYENDSDQWLYMPVIDLSGKTNVNLSFYTWYVTESYYDYVDVVVYNNSDDLWYDYYNKSGCNGWEKQTLIDTMNNGVHIINHDGHAYELSVMKLDIGDATNLPMMIISLLIHKDVMQDVLIITDCILLARIVLLKSSLYLNMVHLPLL